MLDLESTIRVISARETLERITPLAWEKFGITRVANITGLDNIGIPVYVSVRPNSKSLSVSQGKGVADELAKISALMESIETWHAENIAPDKIRLTGCYDSLKQKHAVINPDLFCQTNIDSLVKVKLDWLAATDLVRKQKVYLPIKLFSLDMTDIDHLTEQFNPCSNGLASGNNYEEALCHSLCELIERDAVARWMQLSEQEQDQRLINLNSINDPTAKSLLEKISAAKLNVYVWDLASKFGVPAYYCALADSRKQPYTLFTGSGAHYVHKIALLRAITEAAQARLTYISGSRDDVFPDYYQNFDPSDVVLGLHQTHAAAVYNPTTSATLTSFTEINNDLLEKLVQQNVATVYAVDHTHPSLNISVVHCVSPDLLSHT